MKPRRFRPRTEERKRVEVQQRDLLYLRLLFDFPYLSSKMLYLFSATSNEKEQSRRLRELYDARLIHWPQQQERNKDNKHNAYYVWALDLEGEECLLKHGLITEEELRWRKTFMRGKHLEFWHDLHMSMSLASIKYGLEQRGHRFLSPFDIMARAPKETRESPHPFGFPLEGDRRINPDYIWGIEYANQTYRFFLHEHDEATETLSTVRFKFKNYDWLGDELAERLGISTVPYVTFQTTAAGRVRNCVQIGEELDNPSFLFQSLPENKDIPIPTLDLWDQVWVRSGTPFYLVKKGETDGSETSSH